MALRFRIPGPPLSAFVERFWFSQGDALPHPRERILPDGSMELVFELGQEETRIYDRNHYSRFESFRGAVICGPQSEFFVIDTSGQASVAGVHFKPGGAFPFLGMPAAELHGRHVWPGDIWGAAAAGLRERLLETRGTEARFDAMERFLLARLRRGAAPHPAVAYALREFCQIPHTRTIAALNAQTGLGARRLIRLFREQVGMTPKLFCRVRRFQQVVRMARTRPVEWADIAASCGYFDQAHFIRDFRAFSGLNPTAYLARRTEHQNHVPMPD